MLKILKIVHKWESDTRLARIGGIVWSYQSHVILVLGYLLWANKSPIRPNCEKGPFLVWEALFFFFFFRLNGMRGLVPTDRMKRNEYLELLVIFEWVGHTSWGSLQQNQHKLGFKCLLTFFSFNGGPILVKHLVMLIFGVSLG